jgi:Na+/H+ antiporter NhaD/arsenite permease-like protein
MMRKVLLFFRKEMMLTLSIIAALVSMIINKPSMSLIQSIDWRTLGTLFMMLTVLEGFKKESIFNPIIRFSTRFRSMASLSLFLVFGVFFTSMFVTNDVSLIIFVPLTILLFRGAGKEAFILPVISLENIAAVRGSMLMPFGSPQNLFLYGRFGVSAPVFMLHMLPLCAFSAVLLVIFIFVIMRKEKTPVSFDGINLAQDSGQEQSRMHKVRQAAYPVLFLLILTVIVTRTSLWPYAVILIFVAMLVLDASILAKTDYVLLATFLCFFVFSSSITGNERISAFLSRLVAGREYWWSIGISQIISNVPASIVLYPFTTNNAGLIYGLDTAGLCSLIGSLASVINYRIYVREYPGRGKAFIKTFTLTSWAFFIIVVIPGYLLSFWPFS